MPAVQNIQIRKDKKGLSLPKMREVSPTERIVSDYLFPRPTGSWLPFEFPRKIFTFCNCFNLPMFMTFFVLKFLFVSVVLGLPCGVRFLPLQRSLLSKPSLVPQHLYDGVRPPGAIDSQPHHNEQW